MAREIIIPIDGADNDRRGLLFETEAEGKRYLEKQRLERLTVIATVIGALCTAVIFYNTNPKFFKHG